MESNFSLLLQFRCGYLPVQAERAYLVLGAGLLTAATARLLGFSMAIGAFLPVWSSAATRKAAHRQRFR
jgi:hypothetical protein